MDNHSNMQRRKPFVVVLTPTKNEASIIGRFLACCSMFADKIVLLDQNSTDDTILIAKQFSKAEIHSNSEPNYNERNRQRLLLDIARKRDVEQLIILTLDADEIPTADILSSHEWSTMLSSPPGTVFLMPRLEILPGFHQVLIHNGWPFGYVDDGTDQNGKFIHSVRIPIPQKRVELTTSQIKVLHYSFVRPELQAAKNRFYCVKENLHASAHLMERRSLYRYDFIENRIRIMEKEALNRDWIAAYEARGIDMTSVLSENPNWFDKEVEADIVGARNSSRFHFDPIWNRSYESIAAKDGQFQHPPKGLARCLKLIDEFYAVCPFKQAFGRLMEIVLKWYIFCRR